MKILRFIAQLFTIFVVMVAAIWAYDAYKSKTLAQEQQRVEALAEASSKSRALRASHIRYGLLALAGFKVQVAEAQMTNGRLPGSNEEAGLRSPESYRSEIISAVNVEKGGVIEASFSPDFPENSNAWIKFSPKMQAEGLPLDWRCTSNIQDVTSIVSGCTYVSE